MKNDKSRINHNKIVEYWSAEECNKYMGYIYIYSDEKDSPRCQCCGLEKKQWSRLERAHIIADSLGGENIASNYFLLCKECHKNMPDINNREYIIKYVEMYTADYLITLHTKFNEYIGNSGITDEELNKMLIELSGGNKEEIKKYFMNNMTHGGDAIGLSSIRKIPKMLGALDMFYKDKIRHEELEKGQKSFTFE